MEDAASKARLALIVHPQFTHMLTAEPERALSLEDMPPNAFHAIVLHLSADGDARHVLRLELASKTCR